MSELLQQINDDSWLFGDQTYITRQNTRPSIVGRRQWSFQSHHIPYRTTTSHSGSQVKQVYEADVKSAAWGMEDGFCKVRVKVHSDRDARTR